MSMCTLYVVSLLAGATGTREVDNSACGTMDGAKRAVARFRALYPELGIRLADPQDGTVHHPALILVKQHLRGSVHNRYRVLHRLTVRATPRGWRTADELRTEAGRE